MKRILIDIILAIVVAVAFLVGYGSGIKHTIEDSKLSIVEFDDSDIPGSYDVRIWIDLDGQSYEHFGYIG